MRIENSVNQDNCSASLGKPRNAVTEFSILTSQPLKILIIKIQRKCVMFEHLLHTNMIYFCPYLCYIRNCNMAEPFFYTQKIWYLVSALFYLWKCVMYISVLLFFRIWTAAYQNVPKGSRERVSVKCCLHYMILTGRLCHTLQIMQCKLSYYAVTHDFGIMHDKSWGIELALFATTKACLLSQSACRSLRLMYFQANQEQCYTCSIHKSLLVIKLKV